PQQPVGMRADFKEVAVLTFATCTLRCRCAAEQPARQFLHEMQFADAGGPGNQPGMAQTILLLQLAQVLKRLLAPGQKRHQPASPGNGRPVRSATPRSSEAVTSSMDWAASIRRWVEGEASARSRKPSRTSCW